MKKCVRYFKFVRFLLENVYDKNRKQSCITKSKASKSYNEEVEYLGRIREVLLQYLESNSTTNNFPADNHNMNQHPFLTQLKVI